VRDLTDIPVGGYVSHEVDFAALFSRQGQPLQNLIQDEVVTPLANAELGDGTFCSVTVVGHSDRQDTPGMTPESRRADELAASRSRAESARDFIFNSFAEQVLQLGGVVPADLGSMQNGGIFTVAAGSADLVHTVPSDDQRPENRRVEFLIAKFRP
jgi:flagellar motor protein MotB